MRICSAIFFPVVFLAVTVTFSSQAQVIPTPAPSVQNTPGAELDSLRKKEENKKDSVVTTSKYIRWTTGVMLKDSTYTLPLDTTLRGFQNFSPIARPDRPTINLGGNGLAARDLLFNPSKEIGFTAGFHALDFYLLRQDSIRYYRARSPYTELYFANGGEPEQIFRVTHTQNVRPNWNVGVNYFRNGSKGIYKNQKADHTNIALFTWYESPNKRYNLIANSLSNTLKAAENGSVIKDTIFEASGTLRRDAEIVRLSADRPNLPVQTWKQRQFFLRQSYFIGRIDSLHSGDLKSIAATQRVSHEISYTRDQYSFFRNERDIYNALPHPTGDSLELTTDTTRLKNLQNEFSYAFSLRGKSVDFIKNELKLDLGLRHNLYTYEQTGSKRTFQNITLKAGIGYRFSDRINITGNLQQITVGENAGDYLYDAKTSFLLSNSVGRIILGAYLQNKSPEAVYERMNYQYHFWDLSFKKTKINNLSFAYENEKYRFHARSEYFRVANYLYFAETAISKQVAPQQVSSSINLLKVTLRKDFTVGKLTLENYAVYQKTDFQNILRTPELYVYSSIYFANRFFKVLYTNFGVDLRYNTQFATQAYSLNTSQFYNPASSVADRYATYPIADVWAKATLKRTNLFLRYDYASQGLFSKGYYTTVKYPMPDAKLKFGLSWKFYN